MTAQVKPSYEKVKSHYEAIRELARNEAYATLPEILKGKKKSILRSDIALDGFTFDCYREVRKWERVKSRKVSWDWHVVRKKYQPKPKRFELSIWHRTHTLCGAAIGKPTFGGGKLRLDYIESAPEETPLDGLVTDIGIIAATLYADAIGASQLRIMNPVNAKVTDYYLSKPGFSYDQKGDFCYRDLT